MSRNEILEMVRALSPEEQRELVREIELMLAAHARGGKAGKGAGAVLERLSELSTPGGPEDGAEQHDHYIYGTPKR